VVDVSDVADAQQSADLEPQVVDLPLTGVAAYHRYSGHRIISHTLEVDLSLKANTNLAEYILTDLRRIPLPISSPCLQNLARPHPLPGPA